MAVPDLTSVFAELKRRGFIALRNAGYTMSDGWSDVAEARHRAETAGQTVRGGVFYHGQDLERAREGGRLYLAFGAFDDGPEHAAKSVALAQEVCEVLRAHGFDYAWDGSVNQRIAVLPAGYVEPPPPAPRVPERPIVRKAGSKPAKR